MKRDISSACLSMSSYFFKDCSEYIWRYKLCSNDNRFSSIKSWDTKLFIDLRMAFEALLKSILIYYSYRDKIKNEISKKIEKYKHNLQKLARDIENLNNVPKKIQEYIASIDKEVDKIPVGLRYSFDTYEFVEAEEKFYYQTLRSERWLSKFYSNICSLQTALNIEFKSLPLKYKIVTVEDIIDDIDELFRPGKYNKKKRR